MIREEFINKIAPLVCKYAKQYNILCPSAVISQAILESNGGTSELAVNAYNYFGLKYRKNRCPSACGIYYKVGSEQNLDGSYTSSAMQWMKFSNMENGVIGYFDFINISNYKNLKGVTDPKTYLENIKKDGYATSLKYVDNLMSVIKKYNLTQYDFINKNSIITNTTAYTNSPLVTYTKISPNKTSPRNHKIDTISIHCMAGNLSVETCGNVFTPTSRKASSNYGIGSDGRIAMYCEEKDRSWCSSNSKNDHRAITIEVANDGGAPDWHVSDKAMSSLIDLCADICKRNNIKKLVWSTNKNERVNHLNGCNMTVHRDFAAKACPGQFLYDMHGYIADEVNKRLSGVEYDYIPQPNIASPIKNIVKVNSSLNVRNKPNGTKVGSLKNGNEVEILDYQNGWFKIGTDRWVSADYIHNKYGVVTASTLNIRSGAGTNFADIGDLKRNTNVRLLRESNGWYMILHNKKSGWVSSEYIEIL